MRIYAAGGELVVKELRSRLRTMSVAGRIAVAILVGTILATRLPSSAIAVVRELRATGPFTQAVLAVTMIKCPFKCSWNRC
jgi:hypothetical protein